MRALAAALVLCFGPACKHRGKRFDDAQPRPEPGERRGTFALSYYWVSIESDHDGRATTTIYDRRCAPLAKVSAAFASALDTSGAGKLVDDRLLTVAGECACKRSPCYRVSDAPWGVGVDNRPLVPFRSLAVDRARVPIGAVLWIEELDGVELPGMFPARHDGCVVAEDVGGRITGDRIDWFVGHKRDYALLHATYALRDVSMFEGGERCR
jgi:3D (Asp-Asp-Asp) domain-containing protein